MSPVYYGYDVFLQDIKSLAATLKPFAPEAIVAVARGGVCAGQFLSEALDIRQLLCINSVHYEADTKLDTIKVYNYPDLTNMKRVVIVDDIVDSGDTMKKILGELQTRYPGVEFKVAALFQKKSAAFMADFWVKEASAWIDFFWEVDPIR